MAKKEQRITDKLNVTMTKVSTCVAMAADVVSQLPASEQKRQLVNLLNEADVASGDMFSWLGEIRKAAESI